jgi:radical SAM/Cys-rich protein
VENIIMALHQKEQYIFSGGDGIEKCSNVVENEIGGPLRATRLDTIQMNVGFKCNQSCTHCHIRASPDRNEMMGREIMEEVLRVAAKVRPKLVDITGGAPEYNPHLPWLVRSLMDDGHRVQVRTNLTVLEEKERMMSFYRDSGVKLVASLPCFYRPEVDSVRGEGVFDKSIRVLQRLNELGYGKDHNLVLDLVFNPEADFLPGEQKALQARYRDILGTSFGIVFNDLLTIANMPVGRFRDQLQTKGALKKYNELLRSTYNPRTVEHLMCLSQIDIGPDGMLFDCDFNLAAGLPADGGRHIRDFDLEALVGRRIVTGHHCFGCTAGQGSSCGGALE